MAHDQVLPAILLVDDEPHVTDGLSRHFPRRRFMIFKAHSAVEAYKVLDTYPIDVVVSDEQMPGESGSQFLAGVRKRYPNTIRMILSGQASLEAAVRAINEGEVYRFFIKPCNPVDLLVTIQQAVSHKRLEERSRELLAGFRQQAAVLHTIEQNHPELVDVEVDATGAISLEEAESDDPVEALVREIEASMSPERRRLRRA